MNWEDWERRYFGNKEHTFIYCLRQWKQKQQIFQKRVKSNTYTLKGRALGRVEAVQLAKIIKTEAHIRIIHQPSLYRN